MMPIVRGIASLAVVTMLGAPASASRVHLHRPPRGFQMRMGKFTVPPAHEREVCEYRTFPNEKPMDVQQFEWGTLRRTQYSGTDEGRRGAE